MDAFLSKITYHATSYAIRSCLALTSTLVIQQGSRLLKIVDDAPLRTELAFLQRRLARKIELLSPVLDSLELRYSRGDSALEAVVQIVTDLREDISALAMRLAKVATPEGQLTHSPEQTSFKPHRTDLLAILAEMKQLIASIDDSIPLIHLWVSAIGGMQTEVPSFSPSRLLQASLLVNVGDTQYVLDPAHPMQIGPDFAVSLYTLFRGHASAQGGELYGTEAGQRKPTWQEVIHKARVRLYRVPAESHHAHARVTDSQEAPLAYSYQLQIVEDLDDGRVHTVEIDGPVPGSYDGVQLAGIRQLVPVGQISKIFYTDVGRILNISNEDGVSRNPVLLLKRQTQCSVPETHLEHGDSTHRETDSLENSIHPSLNLDCPHEETSPQDEIDQQLRQEIQAATQAFQKGITSEVSRSEAVNDASMCSWALPLHIDPEWLALEVFDFDDSLSTSDGDEAESTLEEDNQPAVPRLARSRVTPDTSIDGNLVAQLRRMRLNNDSFASSRPSTSSCSESVEDPVSSSSIELNEEQRHHAMSPTLMEQSPFSAIKTSLSLLEMILRLTSLQEFEQMTHLAISDHALKFYLDGSASESGFLGKRQRSARAEATSSVGFDPYREAS